VTTQRARVAPHRRPWTRLSAVSVVTVLLAAGCSTAADPEDPATELLFSPDPTAAPTEAASPTPQALTLPDFPTDCTELVPTRRVRTVVAAPMPGDTTYVFADALPDIGRTARVTCGYGVGAGRGPGPAVEITVNDYESDEAAQARIEVTLDAAGDQGNRVQEQPVGPYDGWVISDSGAVSLVVDAGTRTLVITMKRGIVERSAEQVVLERLATEALGLPTETVVPEEPDE
jgi:hypothetical protein